MCLVRYGIDGRRVDGICLHCREIEFDVAIGVFYITSGVSLKGRGGGWRAVESIWAVVVARRTRRVRRVMVNVSFIVGKPCGSRCW